MKKWGKRGAVVLGIVAVLGWGLYEATMRAWIHINEYDQRSQGLLQVGDLAPDLAMENADGSGPRPLSDFYQTRPLVLIFGSYT